MKQNDLDINCLESILMSAIRGSDGKSSYLMGYIHGIISSYWMLGLIDTDTAFDLSPIDLVKGFY